MKYKLLVIALMSAGLVACGGGGGSSNDNANTNDDSLNDDTQVVEGNTNDDGEVLSSVTRGYSLPSELSAVPTDNGNEASEQSGFRKALRALSKRTLDSLDETSDYHQAVPRKFVEEKALEQFEIIEQILNAIGQTRYADEGNINQGPYTAMVSWEDEKNGRDIKTLQPWVIDSRMIIGDGPDGEETDINRVLAWIKESRVEHGMLFEQLIKAEFRVYQAADVNDDGSYANYGVWDMNVSFSHGGTFAASVRINEERATQVAIHDSQPQFGGEMKGLLVRTGATGYGKVQFPDFDSCKHGGGEPGTEGEPMEGEPTASDPMEGEPTGDGSSMEGGHDMMECEPESVTAKYAYNQDYLAVSGEEGEETVYKDRDMNNALEMVHRYKLFFADANVSEGIEAGDDVEKHKAFGFPISFDMEGDDEEVFEQFAYYGAWQGRHEIWGPGDLESGTVVRRQDQPAESADTYTVSAPFNGTLTSRSLVDGSLADIQDAVVETWINDHFDMRYDGIAQVWKYCDGYMDWQEVEPGFWQPTCRDWSTDDEIEYQVFDDFSIFAVSENDRKWVGIGRWDHTANEGMGGHEDLVYLAEDPGNVEWSGAGLYPADFNSAGMMSAREGASQYAPEDGDEMWADIGGSLYIQYNGDFSEGNTGWVQKALAGFDEDTWTAEFDDSGDLSFSPKMGQEYYIHSNGANFIVRRVAESDPSNADDYHVLVELQSAMNPVNYQTMLPEGTDHLRAPWRPEVSFNVVTDPESDDFLKLVYAEDDPNTQDENEEGMVYTSGEWGLQAYNADGGALAADGTVVEVDEWGFPVEEGVHPTQFNWEYSAEIGWGTQQFLLDNGEFVLLSDPLMLQSLELTNGEGETKSFQLQFDGWMHGLADFYHELERNNWDISAVAQKVFSVPAGTLVSDGTTNYYVKPMEVSVFLRTLSEDDVAALPTDDVPDITQADAVALDDVVPSYVDHEMGDMPEDADVRYSEGKEVNAGADDTESDAE